ncbi:DUF7108 family protein [Halomarina ordinaria]|uniref:RnhA operon protein n=1 Tax=Halomarina ordinaria TaxID=3033939 RepID=A0ABD5UB06_9EURY|nr:rnhA operon protein [Halomarina sp. PSRA2]
MTEVPDDIVTEATRLTRNARDAVDPAEARAARERRDDLVAAHDFVAREREEDATLVLYPEEWLEGETVRIECIDDTDRAIERPLEGPGNEADWESVEAHNRAVAERVAEVHGSTHGENAAAFADFMGNHYARPIETATASMREEFLTEYYPRNAWPSKEQRAVVEKSLDLTVRTARES